MLTNITHLSAPAHDNILLMRLTWKGCKRTRRWKASLPQCFTRYLLAQIRPASRASDDSCSYSSEIRWMHRGKSSTRAFLRPKSKMRIFGSEKKKKEQFYHQCPKTGRVASFAASASAIAPIVPRQNSKTLINTGNIYFGPSPFCVQQTSVKLKDSVPLKPGTNHNWFSSKTFNTTITSGNVTPNDFLWPASEKMQTQNFWHNLNALDVAAHSHMLTNNEHVPDHTMYLSYTWSRYVGNENYQYHFLNLAVRMYCIQT